MTRVDEDPQATVKKFQRELHSGTTSLVLLGVLARAKEPLYGYLISKQIESGETEMLKQGALYPVLRSLERGGLVQSSVKPSVSGPPRRYYRITDRGQAVLEEWTALWRRSRDFVDAILEGNVHV